MNLLKKVVHYLDEHSWQIIMTALLIAFLSAIISLSHRVYTLDETVTTFQEYVLNNEIKTVQE